MPRGLADKTVALIDAAREILEEIQPASIRAVCYRLFNRKLIPSMEEKETKRVSGALRTARERDMIPWEWIVDETREMETTGTWADPDSFIYGVQRGYRRDYWQDQPSRVLVVSEKATIGGTLRPVLDVLGVSFVIYHGFGSTTALNDLAVWTQEDERPVHLLYIGDHDPSGRHMSDVDIPKRLERYGGIATVERLAVEPSQIADQRMKFSAHTKKSDTRYRWFLSQHGETCFELDALSPVQQREIVSNAIERHIDPYRWNRAMVTEQAETRSLSEFMATWPGAA